jgi:hypothetical protein
MEARTSSMACARGFKGIEESNWPPSSEFGQVVCFVVPRKNKKEKGDWKVLKF